MQAATFAMTGSAVNIVSPCACEGLRIYSLAHSFTFQWTTRSNEVDPASGVKAGAVTGAAISAEESSASDFFIEVLAPRGNPFVSGEIVGVAIGTNADVVYARPIRSGNS